MSSKRFKKLPEKTFELPSESIEKLLPVVKKNCTTKFDESVDLSFQINNKQKKGEINIRTVVNLPNVTHEELVKFCDYSRRKFYLNPYYIFRKAKQSLFSFTELRRNLKGFKSLFPYLIKGSDLK